MLAKSLEDQLMAYHDFRVHKALVLYVPPVLLALGTVGNMLSFIILTRKGMRSVSSYVYLAVLSVTDTLVLYVGLLRLWIGELTQYDIRNHADWLCKTISAFGYTVSDYSVWLIIAVTVERYIAVCHALRAPAMCNRRRALKVIISIGLIIFAINFHFFFTTQIRMSSVDKDSEEMGQCNPAKGFDKLFKVWHFVDAFIYSFLPFVILSVLNGLIIHKVVVAKKSRHDLSERVTHDKGKRGGSSPSHHRGHSESNARITVMLLTISCAFVITTLPVNINLILKLYWTAKAEGLNEQDTYLLFTKATMVGTIAEMLMYTNHSMNFFLYCATGHKFRQQLCELFRCGKSKRNAIVSRTTNHTTTTHVPNSGCVLARNHDQDPSRHSRSDSEKNSVYIPVKTDCPEARV